MKRIVLGGGSGFLGRALAAHFANRGWQTVILTRHASKVSSTVREIAWDAKTIGAWQGELEGADVVINLTGKSVNCRYNARNRKEILESRMNSTRVLGEAIVRCSTPPVLWLNSSTATIYKHTLSVPMDEGGEIGATPEAKDAFSVEVATAWERTVAEVQVPATRKVVMRLAMVLGSDPHSVFPALRRLARSGLGGKMGSGRQYVSWIHMADFCRAVEWLIAHEELDGAINIAAPEPVQNYEMMKILRQMYGVPIGLPAARWMLEVGAFILGTETELIIKSRRVIPGRLLESGFQFQFASIQEAFEDLKSL